MRHFSCLLRLSLPPEIGEMAQTLISEIECMLAALKCRATSKGTHCMHTKLSRMFFIAFYCVLLRYLLKPPLAKISDDNIPLVLTFHPFNYKVRDVISRNFQILKNDPETSVIFTNNPSTFSCSRARCYTCSFFNSATSISGPKSNFVIQHNSTCTSSNIIILHFLQ